MRSKPPMIARAAARASVAGLLLLACFAFAQADHSSLRPLRLAPSEQFTVNPGVRDLGPSTVSGKLIFVGGPSGRAGLFAIDTTSGKLKWSYRAANGNSSVSTAPAVWRDVVIAPFGAAHAGAVIAVSVASGKEVWRGPDPATSASVAVHEGLAYVMGKDKAFYALDAATGTEAWKVDFPNPSGGCTSRPLVREGVVYLAATAETTPGDPNSAASFLFALDAKSGQLRWKHSVMPPGARYGICLANMVLTEDAIFGTAANRIFAIDRAKGIARWVSVELKGPVNGKLRPVDAMGLVDAGSALFAITPGALMALDKATGQVAWELPGQYYNNTQPSMAVAGGVLYFQGSPDIKPASRPGGTLHALDLETRTILWSFSRPTAEANWAFGALTPVDGGLWVDSYQVLVKLQ